MTLEDLKVVSSDVSLGSLSKVWSGFDGPLSDEKVQGLCAEAAGRLESMGQIAGDRWNHLEEGESFLERQVQFEGRLRLLEDFKLDCKRRCRA